MLEEDIAMVCGLVRFARCSGMLEEEIAAFGIFFSLYWLINELTTRFACLVAC